MSHNIPFGYCHCGCGEKTNLAPKTERGRGYVKGQPLKYIIGHHGKGKRGPLAYHWEGGLKLHNHLYTEVFSPNHPYRNKKGYVAKHRLIVEKIIGRFLKPTEVVHHVNENTFDNWPCNLVACENNGYHTLLHQRKIALRECGNATWRKCKFCKTHDSVSNMTSAGNRSWYHKDCRNTYRRQRRAAKRIVEEAI